MARKTKITSHEMCVVHPDGSYSDAELHERILAEGDVAAATEVVRARLARRGYSREEIDSFLGQGSPGTDEHAGAGVRSSSTELAPADTLYLVSCVTKKRAGPCQARDLYVSEWFRKARAYVEATHSPWRILSAKYGLLTPDQVVSRYNLTLNHMSRQAREKWAGRVIEQMDASLPPATGIVLLAGQRYREFLLGYLRKRFPKVEIPMEGLPIGKQLQFLSRGLPNGNL